MFYQAFHAFTCFYFHFVSSKETTEPLIETSKYNLPFNLTGTSDLLSVYMYLCVVTWMKY